jgi:hypothetical protein
MLLVSNSISIGDGDGHSLGGTYRDEPRYHLVFTALYHLR